MVNWKTIEIVFIILFVLEALIIGWAWNVATQSERDELECAYNICEDYPSYYYDLYEEVCHCYNREGNIEISKLLN